MNPVQQEILDLKRQKTFSIFCQNNVYASLKDIADFVGD